MRIQTSKCKTLAFIVSATLAPAGASFAQDEGGELEEIVVTGSAIKRVDLDGSLPIQVFGAEQIDRQGITNAGDLIESVPAMQGFITSSDSVGGSGGGIRTANLRAIGDQYTLSLLNGRRMAPADSGSSIDLNNIPLAAVEQVHILTDGASALYGSDAIAGVVNFMLKDSVDRTTVNVRSDRPSNDGGDRWNFDIVTGFGDLGSDGYSVVASYSHETQDQLRAADRDFARTGFVFFNHNNQEMYFQNSSANSIPGNAYVYTAGFGSLIRGFNPNALANGGTCATQTTPDGETCRFDYTSTLEILPESERDSFTVNGRVNLTENIQGWATVLASQFEMTARIAPYPTGEIPLWSEGEPVPQLVQDEVFAYLTPAELSQAGEVTGTWRAVPANNRTTRYDIDSVNMSVGLDGIADAFDWTVGYTYSTTEIDQDYPTGWLLLDEFVAAASSASFNIFAAQDQFSESDQAALDPTVYSGDWDVVKNEMHVIDGQVSRPVFDMRSGEAMLAVGFDFRTTNYDRSIADANRDELLLFLSKDTEYELDRSQWGIYSELLLPVTDNFEATVALRYDDIAAVEDKLNGGDIDNGDDDLTYKVSLLWNVNDAVALRGSYGTGFKAPSMREIGEPLSEFGVTSGTFVCPFQDPNDPLNQYCRTSATGDQYDVFRQGSGLLTFESSTQFTFGTVVRPIDNFDMTIDYWNIELDNLVERLTESQIFNNAETYRHLFTTKTNLATGQEFLAIIQAAVNAGTRKQSGVDYSFSYGTEIGNAQLDLSLLGTYVIEAESSLTGSSLGRFGNDDAVVFRNIANLSAALYHGDFTHTLWANYRDGYYDQAQTVEITGTGVPLGQGPTTTVQLEVPSYTVINYQLRYMMLNDSLGLTVGVENLADREPPLSLRTGGAGHQVGWDPRYTDAFGRTYYVQANYAFDF